MIDSEQLLDRFLRYVRLDTEAKEGTGTYPSTSGQWDLAKLLHSELKALGLVDAAISDHAIVTATVPGNIPGAPAIMLCSHMDTSPDASGKGVKPVVHRKYAGGDIVLPGDKTKVLKADDPELLACLGKTIVTTDGTTLLGGDDKCGVSVIMQLAATLLKHPEIKHGPVKIVFTCDEEVGQGVAHVDVPALGCVAGYTLDGKGEGEIEAETFSADKATVTITGVPIHPSIGKGKMVNAVRLAAAFIDRMPKRALSPESTDGRQGFLHPYKIEGATGSATIHILLRDFITAKLGEQADQLKGIARQIEAEYPEAKIDVAITPQYRNMADGMEKEPRAVPLAVKAMEAVGLKPHIGIVRGGTDGSQLTHKGLPCPNLSTGEHHIHSPLEWTCLEEMETAVKVLVELAKLWGNEK